MESYTTDTDTFFTPGENGPVNEGQRLHLQYLDYDGPTPKTRFEADALIEELVLNQPFDPGENVICEEGEEDFDEYAEYRVALALYQEGVPLKDIAHLYGLIG